MLDFLDREREKERGARILGERDMLRSCERERERGSGRERVRERCWDPLIESGEIQREMYAILL